MTTEEKTGALLTSDRATETKTETTTTETKPEDNKPGDGADPATAGAKTTDAVSDDAATEGAETVEAEDGKDKSEPEGAPETYQFEAPEGVTVDMESDEAKAFLELARGDNLTNEKAQQYFNLFANSIGGAVQASTDAAEAAWQAESGDQLVDGKPSAWVKACLDDALIGGDAEKLTANLGIAKLALEKFGDAELDALFTRFNLGNHPAINRFMYRAGLPLQEETSIPRGSNTTDEKKSDADVFFPTQANG